MFGSDVVQDAKRPALQADGVASFLAVFYFVS
jgi:hypothetical protein